MKKIMLFMVLAVVLFSAKNALSAIPNSDKYHCKEFAGLSIVNSNFNCGDLTNHSWEVLEYNSNGDLTRITSSACDGAISISQRNPVDNSWNTKKGFVRSIKSRIDKLTKSTDTFIARNNTEDLAWTITGFDSDGNKTFKEYSWLGNIYFEDYTITAQERIESDPTMHFSLSPNPASNVLNVKFDPIVFSGSANIIVFAPNGDIIKTVRNFVPSESNYLYTLDLSSYQSGSYSINLVSSTGFGNSGSSFNIVR